MDTHPGLEVWWDSSPLIYPSWAEGVMKKASPARAEGLREQLKRLYDPEHPENTLFRGVTTNPPLSLNVLKTLEAPMAQLVDSLIEKNPCVDKEELFWLTYKEVVRRGAEKFLPLFRKTNYRYGYLSGQVDPRAKNDTDKMIARPLNFPASVPT